VFFERIAMPFVGDESNAEGSGGSPLPRKFASQICIPPGAKWFSAFLRFSRGRAETRDRGGVGQTTSVSANSLTPEVNSSTTIREAIPRILFNHRPCVQSDLSTLLKSSRNSFLRRPRRSRKGGWETGGKGESLRKLNFAGRSSLDGWSRRRSRRRPRCRLCTLKSCLFLRARGVLHLAGRENKRTQSATMAFCFPSRSPAGNPQLEEIERARLRLRQQWRSERLPRMACICADE